MTHPSEVGRPAAPIDRQTVEADLTRGRIVELQLQPVVGAFDASHLKEVNRRIFQDLPGRGFADVRPGEFREPVASGDWMKHRVLDTVPGNFFVAYSRMDAAATLKLDEILKESKPEGLVGLTTREFAREIAGVYTKLDYIHPFADGNSRTLRSFTAQLAHTAGFALHWDRLSQGPVSRDALYVARDLAVNAIALPQMSNEHNMRKVISSTTRLSGNKSLVELLSTAVQPLRALAFETNGPDKAAQQYPELQGAVSALRAAEAFSKSLPTPGRSEDYMDRARADIQQTLDAGRLVEGPRVASKDRSLER